MLIKGFQVYRKLMRALRTPFILLLDSFYTVISLDDAQETYAGVLADVKYIPEWQDCDDFAWIMKAIANAQHINAIGFIVGKVPGGLHAWNVVLCHEGVYQLEPQTGEMFERKEGYRPLLAII